MKVQSMWCVTRDMYTVQVRVGKSRRGVSKYKCVSCGASNHTPHDARLEEIYQEMKRLNGGG